MKISLKLGEISVKYLLQGCNIFSKLISIMSCVNLPYEIISHILVNFLYTEYHQKCFLISKKINSIIKTNDLIKEKHIFDNRLLMLKEDDNNNSDKTDLINGWQKFYFYNWGNKYIKYFSLFNQKYNILKSWHEGDIVDAYDFVKCWGPARIIKKNISINTSFDETTDKIFNILKTEYVVRFLGWSNHFDEKIPSEKIRKLCTFTVHPHKKFECISRDCSENHFWTYIKNPKDKKWNMEKVRKRIINEETNDITLFTNENNVYVITPDNIDDTIRCISNISAFLTNSRHTYNFECRPFDF